jgi:putative acetyltransferase
MGSKAAVTTTHRPARPDDVTHLFELRRKSIVALASKGVSVSEAQTWAANLTMAVMERKFRELEIWIAEQEGRVVGWGAIRGDRLEGLYTDPEFAGRGIGTELLSKLEPLLRGRDVRTIRTETSLRAPRTIRIVAFLGAPEQARWQSLA